MCTVPFFYTLFKLLAFLTYCHHEPSQVLSYLTSLKRNLVLWEIDRTRAVNRTIQPKSNDYANDLKYEKFRLIYLILHQIKINV